MTKLFQHRLFRFYSGLVALIGLSAFFYIKVFWVFPETGKGTFADAIAACGTKKIPALVTPLANALSHQDASTKSTRLSLRVGSIQLTAKNNFLTAKTAHGQIEVAISQPDYGTVESLHLTGSKEVFALGEQISYRLNISVNNGIPVPLGPVPLPLLFSRECGFLGRLTQSCAANIASYSNELNAVFLNGIPSFGSFTSLLLGHSSGDRDISRSGTPFFLGDIPNTGHVLLNGPKGFAIYDGQTIAPCIKDSSK
jgi:hypothetical protein